MEVLLPERVAELLGLLYAMKCATRAMSLSANTYCYGTCKDVRRL